MSLSPNQQSLLLQYGTAQIGKPYQFGYKPANNCPDPIYFDCSALIRWVYAQSGILVPDGSENQYEASEPISEPTIGDVGFFKKPNAPTHHIGLFWSNGMVLEARGFEPALEAQGIHSNCVLLRPQSKWEAFSEFTGWRRFKLPSDG